MRVLLLVMVSGTVAGLFPRFRRPIWPVLAAVSAALLYYGGYT